MELGRYVKLVVDKNGLNVNGLDNDMKEIGRCGNKIMYKHGYNVNGLVNDIKESLKSYELGNSLKKITHKPVEDLDNLQKD